MTILGDERASQPPAPPYPGWLGGEGTPPPRPPRRRLAALVAGLGLAAAATGGAAWAATGGAAPAALTTSQIVARTSPGLVDVVSTLGYAGGVSAGTGMVLTPGGEVLTNNHVVQGATSIRVTDVGNGRTYKATVTGYDRGDDVAVLRLQDAFGLKTVTLGDSSTVRAGDKVVGIGNAGGRGGQPSAAAGRVTGLGQTITAGDQAAGTTEQLSGVIRSNAAIQPGDSGGPLVNSQGQVIGMDTAASSGAEFQTTGAQQESFAIPVNKALAIARQIEAGDSSGGVHIGGTAFLGVQVQSSGTAGGGVTVAGVLPGSAAARAGLQAGDEITSVAGHRVTSPAQLQNVLQRYHPGDRISIGWVDQAGQAHTSAVLPGSGPVG
jgi:S1-C subfamily serine protease